VKNKFSNSKLGIIFIVLFVITILIQLLSPSVEIQKNGEVAAEKLARRWFMIIEKVKNEKRISYQEWHHIKYGALLGKDFSYMTTTLGSLEAKQTALNPKFAGLIYCWLKKLKIDSTKTVGLTISGSFPSLAISSLAAIQTIGAKAVLISSIGSSTYGANDPQATWIDIEEWLKSKGGLLSSSSIVTIGGENDSGGGMLEEGIAIIKSAAKRNSVVLYIPSSLEESISMKTNFLLRNKISLLLNIGGNQAAVGCCRHSSILPNGIWENYQVCNDSKRGIISRIYEKGIPIIHLLNIRDLAAKNGLTIGQTN
jgi:poly-gamma-glutamate system protein